MVMLSTSIAPPSTPPSPSSSSSGAASARFSCLSTVLDAFLADAGVRERDCPGVAILEVFLAGVGFTAADDDNEEGEEKARGASFLEEARRASMDAWEEKRGWAEEEQAGAGRTSERKSEQTRTCLLPLTVCVCVFALMEVHAK